MLIKKHHTKARLVPSVNIVVENVIEPGCPEIHGQIQHKCAKLAKSVCFLINRYEIFSLIVKKRSCSISIYSYMNIFNRPFRLFSGTIEKICRTKQI